MYLDLAEKLLSASSNEAQFRSAISRAYYAAYGRAREIYCAKYGPLEGHNLLWRKFSKAHRRDAKKIGWAGDQLREARNNADYDKPFPGNVQSAAEHAIVEARRILERLEKVKI